MAMVRALATPTLVLLAACSVPVAGALEDGEANRVVVALDRASIDGAKEADPGSEGKWRVSVERDDVPRALSVLRDEELPRSAPLGVLDAVSKGSLIPSEAAEHAQLVAGMAGDLQRSLEGVEGILSARVHLSVPPPNPLRDTAPARGTASVLLEHRGSTPPHQCRLGAAPGGRRGGGNVGDGRHSGHGVAPYASGEPRC